MKKGALQLLQRTLQLVKEHSFALALTVPRPSPGGEGAPVRTLGRKRNGDRCRFAETFVRR